MPTRKLPSDHEVLKLYQGGMSYSAIALMYGTTKPAVGFAVARAGGKPRDESSGYMPRGLRQEHWHSIAPRHLRQLARREKAERGETAVRPLSEQETVHLDRWLAMMAERGLAVAYDPDHEPNEASRQGGWYYVNRPEGNDSIIAYDPV